MVKYKTFTILMNNQTIDVEINAGETLIYDVYSEGFLQVSLARINEQGDIIKLGGFLDGLANFLQGFASSESETFNPTTNDIIQGYYQNPSAINTTVTTLALLSPLSASWADDSYQNFEKTEQYIHVQPGGIYYFRISFFDKAIRKKDEIDGEQEFYRRKEKPKELEEDVNNPIPNMSVFNKKALSH
jgi:hypothetical protein